MKRLLKISLDAAIFSFIPIISWFMLGILVDKNLINVFTLTYPIQFVYMVLKSLFSVGPNIERAKEKNKNSVMSSFTIGTIVSLIVFSILVFNIDSYISFMNMDKAIYHNFGIYSVIQLYIQLIFGFIQEKLYFEDKNDLANKYTITFNIINFIVLMICALIFENQIIIITITLLSIFIYLISIIIREFDKFRFDIDLIKWFKYDSVDLIDNIFYFLIFLFGLSNALVFGEEYALAITFVSLITDTQWDTFDMIATVAKIDISEGCFNYKKHLKNAYKLMGILMLSCFIFIMFL